MNLALKNFYEVLPKEYVGEGPIKYDNQKYLKVDVPFTMCIVGPKGSFKTNAAANIRDMFNCFTKFYLFAPTLTQPIWQHMIDKLDELSEKHGKDIILYGNKIDEVPDVSVFDPKEVNLLILDDMTTEDLDKINAHFTNGRHKRLSIMIICHSYFTLPTLMRKNIDLVVLKDIRSRRDLTRILSEFNHVVPIEKVIKMYMDATAVHKKEDKLNFFTLDNRTDNPHMRYRKNFEGIHVEPDKDTLFNGEYYEEDNDDEEAENQLEVYSPKIKKRRGKKNTPQDVYKSKAKWETN